VPRPRTLLVSLALTALPLAGCRTQPPPPAGPDTFVILIDKSASTSGPKNVAYLDYLNQYVFDSLTPGATVIVEPIAGANTHSDPSLRIVTTLPQVTRLHRDATYYLLKGDMGVDKTCLTTAQPELAQFNAARADLVTQARRILLARESSSQTFLIDGMKEASESLEQRPARGILIILSDGIEDSDSSGSRANFNDPAFWSRHPPATLVQDLDPAHAAPGLKGAKVYFSGLAAGSGPLYDHVRTFWQSYFQAAHVQTAAIAHQPLYQDPRFTPTAQDLCK
jgi:hypothetical protein